MSPPQFLDMCRARGIVNIRATNVIRGSHIYVHVRVSIIKTIGSEGVSPCLKRVGGLLAQWQAAGEASGDE